MSPGFKLIALAVLALALLIGVPVAVRHYNEGLREEGRAEIREKDRVATEAQAERNRELQRAAELRYTVQAGVRERFITKTIKEIRYETDNLAACVLSPRAVQLLNDTARCAREAGGAACAVDGGLPDAR